MTSNYSSKTTLPTLETIEDDDPILAMMNAELDAELAEEEAASAQKKAVAADAAAEYQGKGKGKEPAGQPSSLATQQISNRVIKIPVSRRMKAAVKFAQDGGGRAESNPEEEDTDVEDEKRKSLIRSAAPVGHLISGLYSDDYINCLILQMMYERLVTFVKASGLFSSEEKATEWAQSACDRYRDDENSTKVLCGDIVPNERANAVTRTDVNAIMSTLLDRYVRARFTEPGFPEPDGDIILGPSKIIEDFRSCVFRYLQTYPPDV